jgi:AraC-like DNA-binding protein
VDPSALPDPALLSVTSETDLILVRLGVRAAAERLGISERTLRRQFDRRGLRLRDHLVARRREMTLGLLAGDLPVATVASRLGFASSQTFARYVRRQFGATATDVRRLIRARNLSVLPIAEGPRPGGPPR